MSRARTSLATLLLLPYLPVNNNKGRRKIETASRVECYPNPNPANK